MNMKIVVMLLALSCLKGFAQYGKDKVEEKKRFAKLKVKTTTYYQSDYQYNFGKAQLSPEYKIRKTKYDKSGNVIEEIYYNNRGLIENWLVYENDNKNNNTRLTTKKPDGTVNTDLKFKNLYDSTGRLELILIYSDTILTGKFTLYYDEQSNMIQIDFYKVFDKAFLDSFEKHSYDSKGRTTRVEYYDNSANYISREEFNYDPNGKMIEKTDYYNNVFKYSPNGLCTEVTSYGENDTPAKKYKVVYEYYQ